MSQYVQFFIWLPFISFVACLCVPRKNERLLSGIAIYTSGVYLIAISFFAFIWIQGGSLALHAKHLTLFKSNNSDNIDIFISFYFDHITAVFAAVGCLITLCVSIFSRYYMHRDEGFKRYFTTITLFFLAYNLVILSGNFETLFVGWEVLGICSFLLIAYYRDRYLPVKNGLKVISFFRFADVCLVLAMWMSHHLWHENITFFQLTDTALVAGKVASEYNTVIFIAVMLMLAAIIKSAQLPFSSWLPRAMEGPTTSSAIFYGSLSVHLGVFVLLRTYPFWENLEVIKYLVIGIGLATAVIATGIGRVQSTVKTQIAYSSASQIGIIFVEVALGFHVIALIHFAGNAFLRTYQLLVSPSVLSYLIHDQFYNYDPNGSQPTHRQSLMRKLLNSFYILSIKEWNLDTTAYRLLWTPFKWLGRKLEFLSTRLSLIALGLLYTFGVYCLFAEDKFSFNPSLPYVFSGLALLFILKAFSDRADARKSWLLIVTGQFFIALAIALNKHFELNQVILYLSGGAISALIGYVCLNKIHEIDFDIDLNKFHGYAYEKRKLAFLFLLACLGLVAFPITPAFIGFDVLLTHIHYDQPILIGIASLCFVFIELSALRIYARIFLGQHKKAYHPIAFRSA